MYVALGTVVRRRSCRAQKGLQGDEHAAQHVLDMEKSKG